MPNRDNREDAAGDMTRLPSTPEASTPLGSGWLTSSDAISHGQFAPGTILATRYRIVGLLGKGGMGEVYRADDLRLGQQVALKFLPQELAQDPVRLAQFHGEVRLARQISHPNVCRVYDIDETDGLHFLSMEYVDGEDLATLLRRIGRLPEDKALEMARQFCAGVAAAHDRGVLHRDLKPANVMIDDRGRVRVTDFGLAVAAGSADEVRVGTPGYMAPKQLAGHEASVRSDIYAMGLVLYEMFTGRRAFEARTVAELLRMHEADAVTTPTSIVPSLDPAIERAILRCLEREPENRPTSALAVAAALPGGDPLAAALAAGETPSPAMVAAAGREDALSLRYALGGVVTVAVMLAALPFVVDRVSLLKAVPPPKAVDALLDHAQTITRTLGYTDAPRDEYYGVNRDDDYLAHIAKSDQSTTRWMRLRHGRPAAILFWYRSSPRNLVPRGLEPRPSQSDPPLNISGMTLMTTDMQGRLTEFHAVPPQRDTSGEAPPGPDWSGLFAAAELPMQSFTPAGPVWTPLGYADARAAWEGPLPEDPTTRVRIEAAGYRGRPVFFQIIAPWTRATRMEVREQGAVDAVVSIVGTLMLSCGIAGAALAARRHLRRGRSDRRGANRVASFIVAVVVTSWMLYAHHVADIDTEINQFFLSLALGLLIGAIVWLFYLALEPLVRKWQPQMLVGWSRLLAGNIRDPQVGRDVLAGIVAGTLFVLIHVPSRLMPLLVGAPAAAPFGTSFAPLIGTRETIAVLVSIVPNEVELGLILILVFAVLRTWFRRTWVAVGVIGAFLLTIVGLEILSAPGRWTEFFLVALAVALIFTVVLRWGLLATVAMFVVASVLEGMPLTADPSMRYFATSIWILVGALAAALSAAHAARAGQPLFSFGDD